MDEIAGEAGVSHGLAYRYFANKESIVRALVEQAIERSPGLETVGDMPGTPGERLRRVITNFVESRRAQPEFYQLLDQVLHDAEMPAEFRERVHRRGLAMRSALRKLIVQGQEAGEVAAGDPDQFMRAVFALLDGLTRWSARHPDEIDEHFPAPGILLRMLEPGTHTTRKEQTV
jgi:AcrR family transcriptional regulator